MYYIVSVLFFAMFGCSAWRWASPRHYTVDPILLPSRNPFKCHEVVLYL
ncbi:unnamed protein product [Ascophyllum nodosum]